MEKTDLGWYVLPGDLVIDVLRRAAAGEDPDTLMLEIHANCDKDEEE